MYRAFFNSVLILNILAASAGADPMAFDFTGLVLFGGTPYGESIPAFRPVSGFFQYDTNSAVTHTLNGTGYRQQLVGGFTVDFGGIPVQADDYVVVVSNNLLQPGGFNADVFSVLFQSGLSPSLEPIEVNGMSQADGLLNLQLFGPDTLFSDEMLPTSLSLGNFSSTLSFFADTPTGVVDVLFQLTSLQPATPIDVAIPEPSSLLTWAVLVSVFSIAVTFRSRLLSRRT